MLILSNLADPIIMVLSCIQLIHVVLFFHVHMLEVTELTQALCLTLFFFRLLFFRSPPPGSKGGNSIAQVKLDCHSFPA